MTVPSDRASGGARGLLRALYGSIFAMLALLAGGCGNDRFYYGTAIITVSSDPGPFTAYIADITQIALTRNDGNTGYLFTGVTGYGKTIDFAKLGDRAELFGAPAVLEGTYTSATITFNYTSGANTLGAQLFVDVNGTSTAATVVDSTGVTAGAVSYVVKFDPAHPLVITRYQSSQLNFHFDMNVSTSVDRTTSPPTATVRPFLTSSTQPLNNKPLQARGSYVNSDVKNNNFTINAVSFYDPTTYTTAAQGAELIQVDDNTTYNIDGLLFRGSSGLAAINSLAINNTVLVYGKLDPASFTGLKPTIVATQVYAGIAVANLATDRVTGTVASVSGTTIHIRNAEAVSRNLATTSGILLTFYNDLPVTVSSSTPISIDGQPEYTATLADISVGQQIDLEGLATTSSDNAYVVTSIDATTNVSPALVRLTPTAVWGILRSPAENTTADVSLLTLGNANPASLNYAGTGGGGADASPSSYLMNTGTLDLSAIQPGVLTRFDGLVSPFGTAPPDFTATSVTPLSATDQVLTIDWVSPGTTAPFTSATAASGIVVNMANTSLGTSHTVDSGPLFVSSAASSIDLTNPGVTPTIVPDTTLTGQFSIGNPTDTTGVLMFNDFSSFITQLGTSINGTNTILKMVAVGKWNATTNVFTAYRIDVMQVP